MAASIQNLAPGATIGILGGGQLGRMLCLAAARLGFQTHIYSPSADCPAAHVAGKVSEGAYEDIDSLLAFAVQCDVITYEFENVPSVTAKAAASACPLRPNARALDVAQDRLTEKTFLRDQAGVEVAGFEAIENEFDLKRALRRMGYPGVLKTRRFGYDGKGQVIIREEADIKAAWDKLSGVDLILEAFIEFEREVSVIAARGLDGTVAAFPLTENIHKDHILHISLAPASQDDGRAQVMASRILEKLDYVGVMGVEFFQRKDGSLLVNEIAPRVHNSGHWTQDGGCVDQFEQHIRAITGWPLGDPTPKLAVEMTNLLGEDAESYLQIAAESGTHLHLYGKGEQRAGRKMGHVNRVTPLPK